MQIAGTEIPLAIQQCGAAMIFEQEKSGTETWFLADARCPAGYQCRCPTSCRKPDSGALHRPAKGVKKSILSLLYFKLAAN
jgi:hypothetical protein